MEQHNGRALPEDLAPQREAAGAGQLAQDLEFRRLHGSHCGTYPSQPEEASMLGDFKEFALKGNLLELAVRR
jgi:hypothetical protein